MFDRLDEKVAFELTQGKLATPQDRMKQACQHRKLRNMNVSTGNSIFFYFDIS